MLEDEGAGFDLRYARIVRSVLETPWAIRRETLQVMTSLLALRASGGRLTREEIRERLGAEDGGARVAGARSGSIAVIPLHGVVTKRADMFDEVSGMVSLDRFGARFKAALADEAVDTVVLNIDSPGGAIDGVPETAEMIRQARDSKRIVAIADTMAASAAYWIGTAASELSVTPSGEVGSVGVWTAHQDLSAYLEAMGVKVSLISAGKFKVEGNPYEPLGDEARAAMQARVDEAYDHFVKDLATQRGVSPKDVRNGFGEGRVVSAKAAVASGMADRVESLDALMSRLRGKSGPRRRGAIARRHGMAFV